MLVERIVCLKKRVKFGICCVDGWMDGWMEVMLMAKVEATEMQWQWQWLYDHVTPSAPRSCSSEIGMVSIFLLLRHWSEWSLRAFDEINDISTAEANCLRLLASRLNTSIFDLWNLSPLN